MIALCCFDQDFKGWVNPWTILDRREATANPGIVQSSKFLCVLHCLDPFHLDFCWLKTSSEAWPHEQNMWPIPRLCAQSSPAVCHADISSFSLLGIQAQRIQRIQITSNRKPNWSDGQAPFWKNWCAKSVSGVGLCEASALRPEQIATRKHFIPASCN